MGGWVGGMSAPFLLLLISPSTHLPTHPPTSPYRTCSSMCRKNTLDRASPGLPSISSTHPPTHPPTHLYGTCSFRCRKDTLAKESLGLPQTLSTTPKPSLSPRRNKKTTHPPTHPPTHLSSQDMFVQVQEEYTSEGIPWSPIDFIDNADTLSLLEGRMGVISLLNEECLRPQGNDGSFVGKLVAVHGQHPALEQVGRGGWVGGQSESSLSPISSLCSHPPTHPPTHPRPPPPPTDPPAQGPRRVYPQALRRTRAL